MPAVARKDQVDSVQTNHLCAVTTTTNKGSSDVFVNTFGAVRQGDVNTTHDTRVGKSCVPHSVALSSSSTTVFVNGKGIGRQGDSYGSETITTGSSDVFAGG